MKILGCIAFALLLLGCAQMNPLTGGPEDKRPPVEMQDETFPKNYSTNFNSKNISIQFDEWIAISNPQQEVSINPILPTPIDIKLKGKRIEIALNNELEPNTTYTINFGNSISDITQGNVLQNFRYVFSTGSALDSLEFRGTVYDAQTTGPRENILVALYPANYSNESLKDTLPNYYTYTNKAGWFNFENLKSGDFKILAIGDADGNLRFSPRTEEIAYVDTTIQPRFEDSLASMIDLHLFKNQGPKIQVLEKTGLQEGGIKVVFDRPFKDAQMSLPNTPIPVYKKWNTDKDTLQLFWDKLDQPEVDLIIDQDGFDPDTVSIALTQPKRPLKLIGNRFILDPNQDLVLTFNSAISDFYGEDLVLRDPDSTVLPFSVRINPENHFQLIGKAHFKPKTTYELTMNEGAVMDVFGNNVEERVVKITTVEDKHWGKLTLNLESQSYDTYFLELFDVKGNVLQKKGSFYGPFVAEFDQLPPGKYLLRLCHDTNGNNFWDSGFFPDRQPEKIEFYQDVIEIRSNWEVLEIWTLE